MPQIIYIYAYMPNLRTGTTFAEIQLNGKIPASNDC